MVLPAAFRRVHPAVVRVRTIAVAVSASALVASLGACASASSQQQVASAPTSSTPVAASSTAPVVAVRPAALVDNAYYPALVGNSWTYRASTDSRPGSVTETVTVLGVRAVTGGHDVTVSHRRTSTVARVKATHGTEVLHVGNDGSVSVPTVPGTGAGGASVTVTSGHVTLPTPADLKAGRTTTTNVTLAVGMAGRSLPVQARITTLGLGAARVTVPAGTFAAQAGRITARESVSGRVEVATATVYVAKSVGVVKTVVTADGHSSQLVLVASHRG